MRSKLIGRRARIARSNRWIREWEKTWQRSHGPRQPASVAAVEGMLSEAAPLCARQAKAIQAQFHYHAGRAYQLRNLPEKSAEQFGQAAEIDPHGQYGRTAWSVELGPAS
jgi:hypothetical protein